MALFDQQSAPQLPSEIRSPDPILPDRCDYTTLSSFLRCPRFGYFKSIRGWEPDAHEHHLFFGRCYHKGLEAGYKYLQSTHLAGTAPEQATCIFITLEAFAKAWAPFKQFDDTPYFPKTFARGQDMLVQYWNTYFRTDRQFNIIAVEAQARFPLPCGTEFITKIDLVGQDDRGLFAMEHKTSGWLTAVSLEGYNMSYQGEGYLTYLQSMSEEHCRCIYNIGHITKTKLDFLRHEITRKENVTNRYLFEVNGHVSSIRYEMNKYTEWMKHHRTTDKHFLFPFFPRLPGLSCTAFMRACEFSEVCFIYSNPEHWTSPPPGFRQGFWDPELEDKLLAEKEADKD